MVPKLYVNLDHVATVRKARGTPYPDVLAAAELAAASGHADGITLHLREDRRHVEDPDVVRVAERVRRPFNFELSVADDVVALCERLAPPQATLVPERREELTTEGGLDLEATGSRVREVTARLQARGTKVSLFVEPDRAALERARDLGADAVELHTGRYAEAVLAAEAIDGELAALEEAAARARALGLVVNAGHGLTVENVGPIARIEGLADLNIGHALVARALFLGLPGALEEMATAIRAALPPRPRETS